MTNSSSSSPSFVSPTFCAAQRDPAFNSHRPFSGPYRGQATWPTWIAVDVWSGGGEGAGGAEYHAPAHAQTFSPGRGWTRCQGPPNQRVNLHRTDLYNQRNIMDHHKLFVETDPLRQLRRDGDGRGDGTHPNCIIYIAKTIYISFYTLQFFYCFTNKHYYYLFVL